MAGKQTTNTRHKTDDDIYIEEFAKDFFGTNQPDNESLPSGKTEVTPKETNKEKRKNEETYSQMEHNTDKELNGRKIKEENKRKGKRNASKNNSPHPSYTLYRRDSRQSMIERFLELREEFLSLSERLHDASMPKVSKKLIQVLTERQKLVGLLLNMDAPSDLSPGSEEKWSQEEARSIRNEISQKQGFGMPKKAKNVHWSDEHLGGSIIQDPTVYAHQSSYAKSSRGMQKPETHYQNVTKPPPRYKMVDHETQERRDSESERNTHRDLDPCYCNIGVNHEIEYVKEILDEAAGLRREACCMLWRAHYLEQLCDSDGLVKHTYRSTSSVPTLPRYPRLYR